MGWVRLDQRRYAEALQAYQDARERSTRLGELGTVAVSWHQIGRVYEEMGEPDAAEATYRQALAIRVQLGDVAGQANTLNHLGHLYDDQLGRTEEAAAFYRQAADKCVEIRDIAGEGMTRSNLAIQLRKLRHFDAARQEIRRAIECKAQFGHATEPWKTWNILADIETDTGHPDVAVEARRQAIDLYLAYRRDGGENHDEPGRLCFVLTERLLAGDAAGAAALLREVAADPELPDWVRPFVQILQAIVAGRRDRALADHPEFSYDMAAEILFLIERLDR